MSALPSDSPRPTPALRRPWTAREDALLRAHYKGKDDSAALDALCSVLRRSRKSVEVHACRIGLGKREPRFTPAEDAFLQAWYHRASLAYLASKLGRTEEAVHRHCLRVLKLRRFGGCDGFTLTEVAQIMGVSETTVKQRWVLRGLLRAGPTKVGCGPRAMWSVLEPSLIRFLREHPEAYDWRTMDDPSGYYRRIARTAWEGADLVTVLDAARTRGIPIPTLRTAIQQGRLPAIKGRRWFVRVSDLAAYQAARSERKAAKHGKH